MKRQQILDISMRFCAVVALVTLSSVTLYAQPDSAGLFEPVTDTPINTGIALLAAAGIGYGLKKINKLKK